MWVRHMALLIFMVFSLTAKAQEDVCVLEDGNLVFYLHKNWDAEKRRK